MPHIQFRPKLGWNEFKCPTCDAEPSVIWVTPKSGVIIQCGQCRGKFDAGALKNMNEALGYLRPVANIEFKE